LTGVGVALSALTLIVLSFARALDEASEKRKTLAALALDVDGVRYNADKLIASGEKLKKFGVDLGDAMQMVRELARAGVPQDDSLLGMDKTLEYAARLAQATGTEAARGIQASQGGVARHGRRSEEVRDRPAKPAEHRSIRSDTGEPPRQAIWSKPARY
jgi:hypothetical protein